VEISLLCRKTSRRLVTPQFISPAILCAALAAASTASAANWEVGPRVEAGYRYSDNFHLGPPGTEVDVSGGEADAAVTFRTLDPRTQIEITPRVLATYFPDEPDDDSVDGYLDARFEDVTPRRRMGILGTFSHEDVTRSELPEGNDASGGGELGNPAEGDAGRFVEHNKRDYLRVAPFFRYDVTQRQRIEFDAHYLQADFDKQLENAQQDFSEEGIGAGWGYQVSERSALSLHAIASRYETTFDTDAYGAYVQLDTNFTENSRVYVRAGAQLEQPAQYAVSRPHAHRRAHFGGNRSGALPVAYADSPRRVAARRTHAGGAGVARRGHSGRRRLPDTQVRGRRRRFRMARVARLRGDGHLQLSVAGICG
jgi:hypothetical protein